jgi:phosphoglycolate phosphatase-like HAD superfamily hydrolase
MTAYCGRFALRLDKGLVVEASALITPQTSREGRDAHTTLVLRVGHGFWVGIASNIPSDMVEGVLQHSDLHRVVHGIATPGHVGAATSSPAFATFLAAETGADARQIVSVGDHAEDT